MPYIKLLTALTAFVLLTACGGATADKAGGDTTTDCEANAFHADCEAIESAIKLRQSMCLNDNDIHTTCGAIITSFCTENPHRTFAGVCTGDDYLPNRIADCIEGGKADSGNCRQIAQNATKNTTLTACLTNPFDTACESVPDFMSSFTQARTNRASFCDNSDNATNDLCKGDNVTPICKFDLFTAICPDATYGTPRQMACLMDIDEDPSCTGEMGIVTLFCKADPFSTETACMADTYLPDRIADCIIAGNAGDMKCNTLLSDTTMNTAITACLTNPFAPACEASGSAFTTYAETAQTNRVSFCASDDTGSSLCTSLTTCRATPFGTGCGDYFAPEKIADCIMTGNAEDMKCDTILSDTPMNTAITACLTNPFADACASNADFMTYADDARTNRLTFCNDNMNVANDLCTDTNLMNVCVFDPFNAICFTDATYLPARVNNCITDGNAGDMKCDTIVSDSTMNDAITDCLENPFATACESVTAFTSFALARTNRVSFCEIGGNESNALCMDTTLTNLCEFRPFSTACTGQPNTPNLRVASCLDANNMNKDPSCTEVLLVNHADYLASFGDTPPPATVALATANTNVRSFFLSVGAGGIDKTGLGNVTPRILRLGGVDNDVNDPNGVTYVDGITKANIHSFVGLLPSTNLGAPLVEAPMDTTWEGRYYLGIILATNPITFTVTFGAGDQAGTITAEDTQRATTFALDFTATGIITGDVNTSTGGLVDIAQARGLIGEQGLVGVFANTDNGGRAGDLYGGFVAKNPDYTPPTN